MDTFKFGTSLYLVIVKAITSHLKQPINGWDYGTQHIYWLGKSFGPNLAGSEEQLFFSMKVNY